MLSRVLKQILDLAEDFCGLKEFFSPEWSFKIMYWLFLELVDHCRVVLLNEDFKEVNPSCWF